MGRPEYEDPEHKKILDKGSIAAGATIDSDQILLANLEMLVITAQVKYHAAADVSVLVKVKYLGESGIFDTIDYTSFYLTYAAGEDVKRSVPIDVPPMGYLLIQLYNGDDVAQEHARVWWTGQRRKVKPVAPSS